MGKKIKKEELKKYLKKVWYFIWEDDSLLSWVLNVILAYVFIKFLVYPGLGFMLNTDYPIVAVISGSMEHEGNFNDWWDSKYMWYEKNNISKEEFDDYWFKNGFNKGDIMVLYGKKPEKINKGDILIFKTNIRPDPIIHRVVKIKKTEQGILYTTKGDHNPESYSFETDVREEDTLGIAVFKIPYMGYIKIGFVRLLELLYIL